MRRPEVRILQVVGSMKRGGIETWLMSIMRHIDRERFRFDFLVSNSAPSPHEPEIRSLGGHIVVCKAHSAPARFAWNFGRAMREHGPYDVVHAHLHRLNGLVAWLAWRSAVPARIVHSHFDTAPLDNGAGVLTGLRHRLGGVLIHRFATGGLAVSAPAADALFGRHWRADPRFRLFSLGFEPYRQPVDRAAIRAALGIPPEAIVVGHAGRFTEQKNHLFFVDIAAALARSAACWYFLLVGDGGTRPATEERVRAAGLAGRFCFTGLRTDVQALMAGAMDLFLLPSLYEGLPFVLLEAQAAGLPCIFSAHIANEVDVLPALMHRVGLEESPEVWAAAVARAQRARTVTREEALAAIGQSSFDIRNSVRLLEEYYLAAAGRDARPLVPHAIAG